MRRVIPWAEGATSSTPTRDTLLSYPLSHSLHLARRVMPGLVRHGKPSLSLAAEIGLRYHVTIANLLTTEILVLAVGLLGPFMIQCVLLLG